MGKIMNSVQFSDVFRDLTTVTNYGGQREPEKIKSIHNYLVSAREPEKITSIHDHLVRVKSLENFNNVKMYHTRYIYKYS